MNCCFLFEYTCFSVLVFVVVIIIIVFNRQLYFSCYWYPSRTKYWRILTFQSYQKDKKLLFPGDALSNMSGELRLPPRMGCADYSEALKSVEGFAELDFETCLFGHGDPIRSEASSRVKKLLQDAWYTMQDVNVKIDKASLFDGMIVEVRLLWVK